MAAGTRLRGQQVSLAIDAPDEQGGPLKESDVAETLDDCAFGMNGLISIPAASRPRAYGIASNGQDLVADDNLGIVKMGPMRTAQSVLCHWIWEVDWAGVRFYSGVNWT